MIAATFIFCLSSLQPKIDTVKIPGSVATFRMVEIPAGKVFIRGSEIDLKSFWIGETEVTWDVYDIFAYRLDLTADENAKGVDAQSRPSKPYGAADRGYGHAGYAALGMTFNSAEQFCVWLSKKTGQKYRLPTEAEWEYAARAGLTAEPEKLDDWAWYWSNADDKAQPVGKKQANAWGLFDVLGNVMEWVVGLDGKPVAAGGSFMDKKKEIGFTVRKEQTPKWQERDAQRPKSKWWLSDGPFVGLRVVREN